MTRPDLVVVGTSLGGLNAMSALLASLPAGLPVPIAAVQHRAVDDDGRRLATLLQERGRLRVVDAEDKMPLEHATVYLAPADYHLLVEARGLVALSTDPPVRSARPSIDVLFETAADAYGRALIAVLLTGASADGADGVVAVKARGGRVLVEDPATAECGTMPAAAVAAAAVDYILPLSRMGEYLVALVEGTRT